MFSLSSLLVVLIKALGQAPRSYSKPITCHAKSLCLQSLRCTGTQTGPERDLWRRMRALPSLCFSEATWNQTRTQTRTPTWPTPPKEGKTDRFVQDFLKQGEETWAGLGIMKGLVAWLEEAFFSVKC